MNGIQDHLSVWLGLHAEAKNLTLLQLVLRATVVFAAALVMLRLAHKRFFASKNALDILLTFILASTLARAINGSSAFFGTIAVGFFLVILHSFATYLACRFPSFGEWIKGHSATVVRDGKIDEKVMGQHRISQRDLIEDLHLNGGSTDLSHVKEAVLERSGDISVMRRSQVFTIAVENGVQTVRIEIEG